MPRFVSQTRFLLALVLLIPGPASAMSLASPPVPEGPAPVAVAFTQDLESAVRPDDVAVQIASLRADTPWRARTASVPSARLDERATARRASLGLVGLSALMLLLAAHQRTAQARASGPRPTGEA